MRPIKTECFLAFSQVIRTVAHLDAVCEIIDVNAANNRVGRIISIGALQSLPWGQ